MNKLVNDILLNVLIIELMVKYILLDFKFLKDNKNTLFNYFIFNLN